MNLKEAFEQGYRYLVVNRRSALLCRRDAVVSFAPGVVPIVAIFDLQRAWEQLLRRVGSEDRRFSSADVAAAAGMSLPGLHGWLQDGTIRASIKNLGGPGRGRERIFSFRDLFVAAVAGSMRRNRVPYRAVRAVTRFLMSEEIEIKEDKEEACNAAGV